ncbi:hypothetical protein ONS96_005283 [Cadophora gregata f. sp. sojae]|nr:hypothetical protein ONS96_005283 [Cadophora gregata f. sp. sojae]
MSSGWMTQRLATLAQQVVPDYKLTATKLVQAQGDGLLLLQAANTDEKTALDQYSYFLAASGVDQGKKVLIVTCEYDEVAGVGAKVKGLLEPNKLAFNASDVDFETEVLLSTNRMDSLLSLHAIRGRSGALKGTLTEVVMMVIGVGNVDQAILHCVDRALGAAATRAELATLFSIEPLQRTNIERGQLEGMLHRIARWFIMCSDVVVTSRHGPGGYSGFWIKDVGKPDAGRLLILRDTYNMSNDDVELMWGGGGNCIMFEDLWKVPLYGRPNLSIQVTNKLVQGTRMVKLPVH